MSLLLVFFGTVSIKLAVGEPGYTDTNLLSNFETVFQSPLQPKSPFQRTSLQQLNSLSSLLDDADYSYEENQEDVLHEPSSLNFSRILAKPRPVAAAVVTNPSETPTSAPEIKPTSAANRYQNLASRPMQTALNWVSDLTSDFFSSFSSSSALDPDATPCLEQQKQRVLSKVVHACAPAFEKMGVSQLDNAVEQLAVNRSEAVKWLSANSGDGLSNALKREAAEITAVFRVSKNFPWFPLLALDLSPFAPTMIFALLSGIAAILFFLIVLPFKLFIASSTGSHHSSPPAQAEDSGATKRNVTEGSASLSEDTEVLLDRQYWRPRRELQHRLRRCIVSRSRPFTYSTRSVSVAPDGLRASRTASQHYRGRAVLVVTILVAVGALIGAPLHSLLTLSTLAPELERDVDLAVCHAYRFPYTLLYGTSYDQRGFFDAEGTPTTRMAIPSRWEGMSRLVAIIDQTLSDVDVLDRSLDIPQWADIARRSANGANDRGMPPYVTDRRLSRVPTNIAKTSTANSAINDGALKKNAEILPTVFYTRDNTAAPQDVSETMFRPEVLIDVPLTDAYELASRRPPDLTGAGPLLVPYDPINNRFYSIAFPGNGGDSSSATNVPPAQLPSWYTGSVSAPGWNGRYNTPMGYSNLGYPSALMPFATTMDISFPDQYPNGAQSSHNTSPNGPPLPGSNPPPNNPPVPFLSVPLTPYYAYPPPGFTAVPLLPASNNDFSVASSSHLDGPLFSFNGRNNHYRNGGRNSIAAPGDGDPSQQKPPGKPSLGPSNTQNPPSSSEGTNYNSLEDETSADFPKVDQTTPEPSRLPLSLVPTSDRGDKTAETYDGPIHKPTTATTFDEVLRGLTEKQLASLLPTTATASHLGVYPSLYTTLDPSSLLYKLFEGSTNSKRQIEETAETAAPDTAIPRRFSRRGSGSENVSQGGQTSSRDLVSPVEEALIISPHTFAADDDTGLEGYLSPNLSAYLSEPAQQAWTAASIFTSPLSIDSAADWFFLTPNLTGIKAEDICIDDAATSARLRESHANNSSSSLGAFARDFRIALLHGVWTTATAYYRGADAANQNFAKPLKHAVAWTALVAQMTAGTTTMVAILACGLALFCYYEDRQRRRTLDLCESHSLSQGISEMEPSFSRQNTLRENQSLPANAIIQYHLDNALENDDGRGREITMQQSSTAKVYLARTLTGLIWLLAISGTIFIGVGTIIYLVALVTGQPCKFIAELLETGPYEQYPVLTEAIDAATRGLPPGVHLSNGIDLLKSVATFEGNGHINITVSTREAIMSRGMPAVETALLPAVRFWDSNLNLLGVALATNFGGGAQATANRMATSAMRTASTAVNSTAKLIADVEAPVADLIERPLMDRIVVPVAENVGRPFMSAVGRPVLQFLQHELFAPLFAVGSNNASNDLYSTTTLSPEPPYERPPSAQPLFTPPMDRLAAEKSKAFAQASSAFRNWQIPSWLDIFGSRESASDKSDSQEAFQNPAQYIVVNMPHENQTTGYASNIVDISRPENLGDSRRATEAVSGPFMPLNLLDEASLFRSIPWAESLSDSEALALANTFDNYPTNHELFTNSESGRISSRRKSMDPLTREIEVLEWMSSVVTALDSSLSDVFSNFTAETKSLLAEVLATTNTICYGVTVNMGRGSSILASLGMANLIAALLLYFMKFCMLRHYFMKQNPNAPPDFFNGGNSNTDRSFRGVRSPASPYPNRNWSKSSRHKYPPPARVRRLSEPASRHLGNRDSSPIVYPLGERPYDFGLSGYDGLTTSQPGHRELQLQQQHHHHMPVDYNGLEASLFNEAAESVYRTSHMSAQTDQSLVRPSAPSYVVYCEPDYHHTESLLTPLPSRFPGLVRAGGCETERDVRPCCATYLPVTDNLGSYGFIATQDSIHPLRSSFAMDGDEFHPNVDLSCDSRYEARGAAVATEIDLSKYHRRRIISQKHGHPGKHRHAPTLSPGRRHSRHLRSIDSEKFQNYDARGLTSRAECSPSAFPMLFPQRRQARSLHKNFSRFADERVCHNKLNEAVADAFMTARSTGAPNQRTTQLRRDSRGRFQNNSDADEIEQPRETGGFGAVVDEIEPDSGTEAHSGIEPDFERAQKKEFSVERVEREELNFRTYGRLRRPIRLVSVKNRFSRETKQRPESENSARETARQTLRKPRSAGLHIHGCQADGLYTRGFADRKRGNEGKAMNCVTGRTNSPCSAVSDATMSSKPICLNTAVIPKLAVPDDMYSNSLHAGNSFESESLETDILAPQANKESMTQKELQNISRQVSHDNQLASSLERSGSSQNSNSLQDSDGAGNNSSSAVSASDRTVSDDSSSGTPTPLHRDPSREALSRATYRSSLANLATAAAAIARSKSVSAADSISISDMLKSASSASHANPEKSLQKQKTNAATDQRNASNMTAKISKHPSKKAYVQCTRTTTTTTDKSTREANRSDHCEVGGETHTSDEEAPTVDELTRRFSDGPDNGYLSLMRLRIGKNVFSDDVVTEEDFNVNMSKAFTDQAETCLADTLQPAAFATEALHHAAALGLSLGKNCLPNDVAGAVTNSTITSYANDKHLVNRAANMMRDLGS